MQSDQVHIRCMLLGNGMFPNEVAVQLETIDSAPVSALVDRSLLKSNNSEYFLRATLMESEDDVCVCLLPIEAESGSRWVRVQSSSLFENSRKLQFA